MAPGFGLAVGGLRFFRQLPISAISANDHNDDDEDNDVDDGGHDGIGDNKYLLGGG